MNVPETYNRRNYYSVKCSRIEIFPWNQIVKQQWQNNNCNCYLIVILFHEFVENIFSPPGMLFISEEEGRVHGVRTFVALYWMRHIRQDGNRLWSNRNKIQIPIVIVLFFYYLYLECLRMNVVNMSSNHSIKFRQNNCLIDVSFSLSLPNGFCAW